MTSLEKVTEEVFMIFEHFKLIFYALKTNPKCLKTFYNCFSYFYPFLHEVTRNFEMTI